MPQIDNSSPGYSAFWPSMQALTLIKIIQLLGFKHPDEQINLDSSTLKLLQRFTVSPLSSNWAIEIPLSPSLSDCFLNVRDAKESGEIRQVFWRFLGRFTVAVGTSQGSWLVFLTFVFSASRCMILRPCWSQFETINLQSFDKKMLWMLRKCNQALREFLDEAVQIWIVFFVVIHCKSQVMMYMNMLLICCLILIISEEIQTEVWKRRNRLDFTFDLRCRWGNVRPGFFFFVVQLGKVPPRPKRRGIFSIWVTFSSCSILTFVVHHLQWWLWAPGWGSIRLDGRKRWDQGTGEVCDRRGNILWVNGHITIYRHQCNVHVRNIFVLRCWCFSWLFLDMWCEYFGYIAAICLRPCTILFFWIFWQSQNEKLLIYRYVFFQTPRHHQWLSSSDNYPILFLFQQHLPRNKHNKQANLVNRHTILL